MAEARTGRRVKVAASKAHVYNFSPSLLIHASVCLGVWAAAAEPSLIRPENWTPLKSESSSSKKVRKSKAMLRE